MSEMKLSCRSSGKRRKRSFRRRQQNFLFREVPWRSIMESRKSHARDAFCRSRKTVKRTGKPDVSRAFRRKPSVWVIFRTASADASEEEIRQEYLELSEKLARIVQYGTMRNLYSCLYRASDAVPELVKRYAPSVSELVTDDRETYEICREYLSAMIFTTAA